MSKFHVYVDANIWLSLYHYSNNSLALAKKFEKLIGKSVILYLPTQTIDEVTRNRENKFNDAIKQFKFDGISIPVACAQYPDEVQKFIEHNANLRDAVNTLKSKLMEDFDSHTLEPDRIFEAIKSKATIIDSTPYHDIAYRRYIAGNPPGKKQSYGDAINWEALLDVVEDKSDLLFITNDQDYRSVINDNMFNHFLSNEWNQKKDSNIIFFRDLKKLLNYLDTEEKNRQKQERADAFQRLETSGTFNTTHTIISKLQNYQNITNDEIELACSAFARNDQISWIKDDPDVELFYTKLLKQIPDRTKVSPWIMTVYRAYRKEHDLPHLIEDDPIEDLEDDLEDFDW